MPFHKWIIKPQKNAEGSPSLNNPSGDRSSIVEETANRKMVCALLQLSQLVQIAEEIFSGINEDCKVVRNRSESLRIKIRRCQDAVGRLNAKTVPVPVSSLTLACPPTGDPYKSQQARERDHLTVAQRPLCVQHLRRLARGPAPPVHSATDGRPESVASSSSLVHFSNPNQFDTLTLSNADTESRSATPFRSLSSCDSRSSADQKEFWDGDSQIIASVVPIDVTGHTFRRMASFRRSLIHVDFFIRRKNKKDKRRNTVAEGETKVLEQVLQDIVNQNQCSTLKCAPADKRETSKDSTPASDVVANQQNGRINNHSRQSSSITEENNNSQCTKTNTVKCSPDENKSNVFEKANLRINRLQGKLGKKSKKPNETKTADSKAHLANDGVCLKASKEWTPDRKSKTPENSTKPSTLDGRKKSRGYIPISTLSAAMSVAVKMRQTFGGNKSEEAQSSTGNWSGSSSGQASSESEIAKNGLEGKNTTAQRLASDDSLLSDSVESSKPRPTAENLSNHNHNCSEPKPLLFDKNKQCSSAQSSNCSTNSVSSEEISDNISNLARHLNGAISVNKSLYIEKSTDSCESDDDLQNITFLETKYGSSTSLSSSSNGSLNSLLSRTATELSSSSSTLTLTQPLPSPPPPPPRISSASVNSENLRTEVLAMNMSKDKIDKNSNKKTVMSTVTKTTISQSKQQTKNHYDTPKPIYEDPKSAKMILANLIHKKFQSKQIHQEKVKQCDKNRKLHKTQNHTVLNMYGDHSPSSLLKAPAFIKDSREPPLEEPKSPLSSFCPTDSLKRKGLQTSNVPSSTEKDLGDVIEPELPAYDSISLRSSSICSETSVKLSESTLPLLKNGITVPHKYSHQITVIPLRRQEMIENQAYATSRISSEPNTHEKPISIIKPNGINQYCSPDDRILQKQNLPYLEQQNCLRNNQESPNDFRITFSPNTMEEQFTSEAMRHPPNRCAAHIVLDPDGRVIYSTSSLDRRNHEKHPFQSIYYEPINQIRTQPYTMNPHHNELYQEQFKSSNYDPETHRMKQNNLLQYKSYSEVPVPAKNDDTWMNHAETAYSRREPISQKSNSLPMRNYKSPVIQEFYPMYGTLPSSGSVVVQTLKDNENFNLRTDNLVPSSFRPTVLNSSKSNSLLSQSLLTQENVNLHSQRMNGIGLSPQSNVSSSECSYELLPPAKLPRSNKENCNMEADACKIKRATMSAEDLFAVIHDSKRRLNIKTESDISLTPSSSRSSSPSYFRQLTTPTKTGLAETGFLTPRNGIHQGSAGRERRSWADFRSGAERRSLASDRFGPNKPTSMHDFKMLLLQTRSGSRTNGQRKSAVELLKVPNCNYNAQIPDHTSANWSHKSLLSPPIQTSPRSDLYFPDGHSTVPLKRGNRARGTLQPRYIMYPPIFEEAEQCYEPVQNNGVQATDDMNENNQLRQSNHVKFNQNTVGCSQPIQQVQFENPSMWV